MFWIISLFLLILTERSWSKMDFHSVLWREKCHCPPATTDGPSVRRNMGPAQQRCKIYQPCCRINTQIFQIQHKYRVYIYDYILYQLSLYNFFFNIHIMYLVCVYISLKYSANYFLKFQTTNLDDPRLYTILLQV